MLSFTIIVTDSYFDGKRHHDRGPFTIEIIDGKIENVFQGDLAMGLAARRPHWYSSLRLLRTPFLMPGLVEGHCHVFLDGAELDFDARKRYLNAPRTEMLDVARRNVRKNFASGITLIRDAGDIHGINTQIKTELVEQADAAPQFISAGRAIRKAGRYGSFMAVEVTDSDSIVQTIHQLAPASDQLKILLTGIIDFEKAQMKGASQFDIAEAKLIVKTARELGRRTFAHCSGLEGLQIAVSAGIHSIEHGFFMNRDILRAMAGQGIAWVPTFSPVFFQWQQPHLSGWNEQTVSGLGAILENHFEQLALANDLRVPIITGSDAGSYGAMHGDGLIDEIIFQSTAMPLENVLASSTSVPRSVWGCASADVTPGNRANLILLANSPFSDTDSLRQVQAVIRGSVCSHAGSDHPLSPSGNSEHLAMA